MRLLVLCPLRVEALAIRSALPAVPVRRTGMGRDRILARAAEHKADPADAVAIAGFCGAVDPDLRPGDVVVATELRSAEGSTPCASAAALVDPLRRLGISAQLGPVFSSPRLLGPAERAELGRSGVVAVDMESYWLAEAAQGRPLAVLRVVVDRAGRRLLDPRTVVAGVRALSSLRRTAPALVDWVEAFSGEPPAEQLRFAPS